MMSVADDRRQKGRLRPVGISQQVVLRCEVIVITTSAFISGLPRPFLTPLDARFARTTVESVNLIIR